MNTLDVVRDQSDFAKPLVEVKTTRGKERRKIIFWRALFRAYSGKMTVGGLLKIIHDILQFSGPMILK